MKVAFCLLLIAVTVYAESCNDAASNPCTMVDCGSGFHSFCYNKGPLTPHVCTCVPSLDDYICSHASDCSKMFGNCPKSHSLWKCKSHHHQLNCHCEEDDK